MKTYISVSQISNDYRIMRRHLSICKLIWLELNYTSWLIHFAGRQIMKCDKIILATILKVFVMLQKLEKKYWKVVMICSSSTACESCEAFHYSDVMIRHDGPDGVWNNRPRDCLLNRLFRRRSKKISKLRVTGLCAGNSPVTGEFPAQMTSNAENVSIWWRHPLILIYRTTLRAIPFLTLIVNSQWNSDENLHAYVVIEMWVDGLNIEKIVPTIRGVSENYSYRLFKKKKSIHSDPIVSRFWIWMVSYGDFGVRSRYLI